MHFFKNIFLKAIIVYLSFISLVFAHELRPNIANLDITKNEKTTNAKLNLKINLEAIIVGIDPNHSNTKESDQSDLYDEYRKLSSNALLEKFNEKFDNLDDTIYLTNSSNKYVGTIEQIIIPEIGDIEIIRDSTIELSFKNLQEDEYQFYWDENFGSVILRVNSNNQSELHTEIITKNNLSSNFNINEDQSSTFKTVTDYIIIGFEHILPKGLDHILFVLALFLLSTKFKPLFFQVTFFTIAHSITLFLGVLNIVNISPEIVEPIIAISIAYVAFENLFTNKLNKARPFVIFIFGLLHGLGFAGVLTEIGIPDDLFITSLISFNVGVEFGQIAVILIAYLLLALPFGKQKWYDARITKPMSLVIAFVGLYWFIERII
ncbi:HupE/UreJ family protein [Candidatus Pelagibacter sp.]|nr:HupE/UreJ family protein [Candidatus Pelagibacter sp.]